MIMKKSIFVCSTRARWLLICISYPPFLARLCSFAAEHDDQEKSQAVATAANKFLNLRLLARKSYIFGKAWCLPTVTEIAFWRHQLRISSINEEHSCAVPPHLTGLNSTWLYYSFFPVCRQINNVTRKYRWEKETLEFVWKQTQAKWGPEFTWKSNRARQLGGSMPPFLHAVSTSEWMISNCDIIMSVKTEFVQTKIFCFSVL